MYTRFFLQLNQFPKLIMLAALLISFFFFDQVRQKLFDQSSGELIIDSTVEPFIERSSGAYQEFLEVRDAFGNEDVLVVALHQPQTGVGLDFINTLADISHELRKNIPGVIAGHQPARHSPTSGNLFREIILPYPPARFGLCLSSGTLSPCKAVHPGWSSCRN